jgi:hypothetical protein
MLLILFDGRKSKFHTNKKTKRRNLMRKLLTSLLTIGVVVGLTLTALITVCATTITVTPNDYYYDEEPPRGVVGDAPTGWGSGSWQGPATGKSNYHIWHDAQMADLFGPSHGLKMSDLDSLSFWTKSTDYNWWLTIYTKTEGDGGDSGSWYDSRLHAHPGSLSSTWQLSSTDTDLKFYDSPRGYNSPLATLDDLTTGSFWGHDYTDEELLSITLQSNSGWDGFDGQVDGLTITLKDGREGKVNLEPVPEPGTIILLGSGLLGLLGYGVYRKKKS